MADPRSTPPAPRRGAAVWPLVIGAAVVILAAVWFFTSGADIEPPPPTPSSPAATGAPGEPSGVTGSGPQPGAPVGAQAPAGSATVPVRP
ncbi:hypothetical protein [Paracoccus sanguinis]|uniref:Uncharacterized protein n=1 Tax=Paracoccus sanguinis TaxID=1545044 RepID=A0A099G5D9_9RHOB|nr:hypothetical protein [Paracoccus sanguinis]KGJ17965.1 hypothetical protein IX57_06065 [Paracoccus sanguinis]KGJ18683.1 hypothetical protein IX55_11325 [Paracoccus sanguinis]KGJ20598.1 hypothetical protein IX56_13765 [Paracoccus sanguinis]QJD17347.1 hypothetical protein HGN31_11060 [Paracoccus sanguinis]SDW37668.1 hypothetical protein SAMN05444276_101810 [Paracoccus sanguinis]